MVRRLLARIDRNDTNLKIDLLDAIHFLAMSWDRVMSEVIANCVKELAFCGARDDGFCIEDDDEEFVSADYHLATSELCTLRDIIAEATSATVENDDDDEDDDTQGLGDDCGDRFAVTVGRSKAVRSPCVEVREQKQGEGPDGKDGQMTLAWVNPMILRRRSRRPRIPSVVEVSLFQRRMFGGSAGILLVFGSPRFFCPNSTTTGVSQEWKGALFKEV
ncbi:hypothetical protein HPB47_017925 [Ixodes persulcatus]|uniref:Uncharacterized protein n=1 Tax=Ixodes persulcatus TaxID=34615 RepID=A0AC60QMV6_IXOPE|nr:hypothetical protein HPB47_017925 [Ixodes persulcatus]